MNKFGEFVRSHRLKRQWTQEKLAKKLGVSGSCICRIEKGERAVSDRLIKDLAIVFKMAPDELFLMVGKVPKERECEAVKLLFGGTENR